MEAVDKVPGELPAYGSVTVTNWEAGNALRNICDSMHDLQKELSVDMVVTAVLLRTCRLALGHLSNKMCDDGVLINADRELFVDVCKVGSTIKETASRQ